MNIRNRVSICTLIIGLICPFTQVARGQQSGPVQPPPSGMIAERSESCVGGPSESIMATANNRIARLHVKVLEVTRRNIRMHFIHPLKERIVREVGYGPSLEGASADPVSKQTSAGRSKE